MQIIQGGMGVAISDWRLAQAVSRTGQLGVVSGTGIAPIMVARLQTGDAGGHLRRAFAAFPDQTVVAEVMDRYFVADGIPEAQPFKRPPLWTLEPPEDLVRLTVLANFAEVWLAKEGHDHAVGINLMQKIQLPNPASLYGAILAGVDIVIVGAGIPMQIPGMLAALSRHEVVEMRVDAVGSTDLTLTFDPRQVVQTDQTLQRPLFYPIVSSVVLAKALLGRASGPVDGFIVEGPVAGGHNAPPRGPLTLNAWGEPEYGRKDEVDLGRMAALERPFWVAGGYGDPAQLQAALDAGAQGVQIGTPFAFCAESGMDEAFKAAVVQQALDGQVEVLTSPTASPTGFPFKVVQLADTLADGSVYQARQRVCDMGFLREVVAREDGEVVYRCAAEPEGSFERKGGAPEETAGRVCLCNGLSATAGWAQRKRDGRIEPPVITSGDEVESIAQFVSEGVTSYTAADVVRVMLDRD